MKTNIQSSLRILCGTLALSLGCVEAGASTIFADTFDGETLGLNAVPSQWAVTAGTVDIIGNPGFYDFLPGNGRYLDMDGSTATSGAIQKTFFGLAAGNYVLSYYYAGNQRVTSPEGLDVSILGGLDAGNTELFASYVPGVSDFFTLGFQAFYVLAPTDVTIEFKATGAGDNYGVLLDNVKLEMNDRPGRVPEGGSGVGLLGGALLGLAAARRFGRRPTA